MTARRRRSPWLPAAALLAAVLGAVPPAGAAGPAPPEAPPAEAPADGAASPWDGAPFPPPGDAMASLARGGRWTEALSLYRLQLLRGHMEKERWEEALRLLERMERSRDFSRMAEPGELRATLSASIEHDAAALAARGLVADALSLADLSVRFAPGRPAAWTLRAWCRHRLGSEEAAEADYRVASSLEPRHLPAWAGLSRLLEETGRPREATALWDRFLERTPSSPDGWFHRAGSLLAAGNPAGALRDLERACALGSAEGCRKRDELRPSPSPHRER